MAKIIVGPGRLSFPHIIKAKPNDQGTDVWSLALLLPPDDVTKAALRRIVDGAAEAARNKWGPDEAKWPKGMRMPRDIVKRAADSDHYGSEFDGWYYINASAYSPPGVVDAALNKITPDDKGNIPSGIVYPGRWAKISVNPYAYTSGKKGVTLGLNNVQLLKHAEPLAGRSRAEDDFTVEGDDFDAEGEGKSTADEWA